MPRRGITTRRFSTELTSADLDQLRDGVQLKDGATRPALVRRLNDRVEITITEGRNRQVRRMIEAVGSKVVSLVRPQIGPILTGNLLPGQWRYLTAKELSLLD